MQTPGQAFRKALEKVLGADTFLTRTLRGGLHFNFASQLSEDTEYGVEGEPPPSPYAVITIAPFEDFKGNGGRSILYRPVIRMMVYANGNDSILRSDTDACARKIDTLVKSLSETIADDTTTADDFQVLNFYFERGYNDDTTDRTGSKYARIGADYLGYGYYVNCT